MSTLIDPGAGKARRPSLTVRPATGTPGAKRPAGRPPRAYVSTSWGLLPLSQTPWDNRNLRANLEIAVGSDRFLADGAFAIVYGKHPGTYTAKRVSLLPEYEPVILTAARLDDGRWVAHAGAGEDPREILEGGRTRPWEGPLPVSALVDVKRRAR